MITHTELLLSLKKLEKYIEGENYKGYDPYDLLNSTFNLQRLGYKFCFFATQLHKRNPLNIRSVLGIKKDYIHKGMGLFLSGYCNLYEITGEKQYREKMDFLFNWLINANTKGYKGYCWGLNYDYASGVGFFYKNLPSLVVTSFISNAIYEYYKLTQVESAKEVLKSVGDFILNDLPVSQFDDSICFSYTPLKKTLHFNANALGAQLMAKLYNLTEQTKYKHYAIQSIDYVIKKQKPQGYWNYSEVMGEEKRQIDFHQGFILDSICDIIDLFKPTDDKYILSYKEGLKFYKDHQFFVNGRSKWRLPKENPVDIHNQAQGIITFSKASKFNKEYPKFAFKIAEWTINNMQSKEHGYFYYRKYPLFVNKIPLMRWNQAWMFLALTSFLKLYVKQNGIKTTK